MERSFVGSSWCPVKFLTAAPCPRLGEKESWGPKVGCLVPALVERE